MLKTGYCYNQHLKNSAGLRVKSNDNIIGCAVIVSVSALCSRYYILAPSSYSITHLYYVQQTVILCWTHTYSIEVHLYLYALPIV